jgi:hypothetical protein
VATFGAFFDANVLYPSGLRNFLMHLALTGGFGAYWSADVHEEWIGNLLKNRPDLTRETGTYPAPDGQRTPGRAGDWIRASHQLD